MVKLSLYLLNYIYIFLVRNRGYKKNYIVDMISFQVKVKFNHIQLLSDFRGASSGEREAFRNAYDKTS